MLCPCASIKAIKGERRCQSRGWGGTLSTWPSVPAHVIGGQGGLFYEISKASAIGVRASIFDVSTIFISGCFVVIFTDSAARTAAIFNFSKLCLFVYGINCVIGREHVLSVQPLHISVVARLRAEDMLPNHLKCVQRLSNMVFSRYFSTNDRNN